MVEPPCVLPNILGTPLDQSLTDILITTDTDANELKYLRVSSALGPDEVHHFIIQKFYNALAAHLTMVMNNSLKNCIISIMVLINSNSYLRKR